MSCTCLDPSVLQNTRRSVTPTITLAPKQFLQFTYTSLQDVPLQVWFTSTWAQQGGLVGPFSVTLPKAVGTVGAAEFAYLGNKLAFAWHGSGTVYLPIAIPAGENVQFELQGWSKEEITLRNVTKRGPGVVDGPGSVTCFTNQTAATKLDQTVACTLCLSDNVSGCFSFGGDSTIFIIAAGLAAVVALFLLRRLL